MEQLTFDLPVRAAFGLEDFMVTPANEAAVNLIDSWPDWPTPMVAIAGPKGSGKTHLAEVWRARSGARSLSIGDLTVELVPAALDGACLIIEDVPEKNLPEQALFHLFNLAKQQGGHVLLTSPALPARWQVELPDLQSRLRSLAAAELGPPDNLLLRALLIKQFDDRQLDVEEDVVSYLINRIERSAEMVSAVVAEIDRAALSRKARITRAFVARLMPRLESSFQEDAKERQ